MSLAAMRMTAKTIESYTGHSILGLLCSPFATQGRSYRAALTLNPARTCRSGLVSRKGRKAAPIISAAMHRSCALCTARRHKNPQNLAKKP